VQYSANRGGSLTKKGISMKKNDQEGGDVNAPSPEGFVDEVDV
jgi:hypothetical protein